MRRCEAVVRRAADEQRGGPQRAGDGWSDGSQDPHHRITPPGQCSKANPAESRGARRGGCYGRHPGIEVVSNVERGVDGGRAGGESKFPRMFGCLTCFCARASGEVRVSALPVPAPPSPRKEIQHQPFLSLLPPSSLLLTPSSPSPASSLIPPPPITIWTAACVDRLPCSHLTIPHCLVRPYIVRCDHSAHPTLWDYSPQSCPPHLSPRQSLVPSSPRRHAVYPGLISHPLRLPLLPRKEPPRRLRRPDQPPPDLRRLSLP